MQELTAGGKSHSAEQEVVVCDVPDAAVAGPDCPGLTVQAPPCGPWPWAKLKRGAWLMEADVGQCYGPPGGWVCDSCTPGGCAQTPP